KAHTGAGHDNGLKERALAAFADRLHNLPSTQNIVRRSVPVGEEALKVLVGIFFTGAVAAYWLFERDRAVDLVTSLLPRPRRKVVRDPGGVMGQELGAVGGGELVLIAFVAALSGIVFVFAGEPYWLLLGIAGGFLEIVPVVGPLAALLVTVAAGLTVSWQT